MCELYRTSLNFLGHVESKAGISTDPKKIQVIKDWPIPDIVTDVRSFWDFPIIIGDLSQN